MLRIKVTDMESAWAAAQIIFPTTYMHDEKQSNHYDRPVYTSTEKGYDGFEIHEHEKQLWVYLGERQTVKISIVGASPSETEELAEAKKRIAELEEDMNQWAQSHWTLAKACDEADKLRVTAQQRAEQAEAETVRLKAKLYDILIERKE